MLVTHTQLALNTISNVDPIQVIFPYNYAIWCLTHMYDSDYSFQCIFLVTSIFPKEGMSQIMGQGPNIASYLTLSLVAILPSKE